jgi:hypothetical protein
MFGKFLGEKESFMHYMFYKVGNLPPDMTKVKAEAIFERPARLRIRKANGDIEVIGVGVLDKLEYFAEYPRSAGDNSIRDTLREEVKLTDGSSIICQRRR